MCVPFKEPKMVDVSDEFWGFVGEAMTDGCIDSLRETLFYAKVATALEHEQKLIMSYASLVDDSPEAIVFMSPQPDGTHFSPSGIFFDSVDCLFRGVRDILLYLDDPRAQCVHECLVMLLDAIEIENSLCNLKLN